MEGGPPVFPPGFTCPAVLWILSDLSSFRLRDSHTLWSAFPCSSTKTQEFIIQSATPCVLLLMVWPISLSLATTYEISFDFSSSPYLDVSVQAVPSVNLWIQLTVHGHSPMWVSPFGNLRINTHLQFPAAYRSLSRPSSAPSAKAFPLRSF